METSRHTRKPTAKPLQIDIDDLKRIVVHEWWPFIQKKYPKNQKYSLYEQITPLKIYSNESKKYMIFGFTCTVTTYQPTGYKDPTRQLGPCWIGIEFSKRDRHWHLGREEEFNNYLNEYLNDREAHGKNHMVNWKRIAFKANDKIALDEVDSSGISGYTLQSLDSNLLETKEKKVQKKKMYTKKQITEAIAYWEKQLKLMNEDANGYHYAYTVDPYLYVTTLNSCFSTPVRKVGASHGSPTERENPETLNKKLKRYNTCVTEDWKPAYQIILDDADGSKVFTCEKELFELLASSKQGNKELFTADDSAINAAISEFKTRHPTAEIVKYID